MHHITTGFSTFSLIFHVFTIYTKFQNNLYPLKDSYENVSVTSYVF